MAEAARQFSGIDRLVARLAAAFPRQQIAPANVDAYTWGLEDLEPELAERAVMFAIRTLRFFPTVAELLAIAAELATALPDPHGALELAEEFVQMEPTIDCPECEGRGEIGALDEELPCARCRGRGIVANPDRPSLPLPVSRALRIVGGPVAWRSAEQPSIMRAQFLKAYEEFAAEARKETVIGALSAAPRAIGIMRGGGADA